MITVAYLTQVSISSNVMWFLLRHGAWNSAKGFFKAALGEVTSRELLAHPPHTRVMRLPIPDFSCVVIFMQEAAVLLDGLSGRVSYSERSPLYPVPATGGITTTRTQVLLPLLGNLAEEEELMVLRIRPKPD